MTGLVYFLLPVEDWTRGSATFGPNLNGPNPVAWRSDVNGVGVSWTGVGVPPDILPAIAQRHSVAELAWHEHAVSREEYWKEKVRLSMRRVTR